ncbi:MAG: ABC transporter permease, partial [Candidatus Ornithomonoglobus sp.]
MRECIAIIKKELLEISRDGSAYIAMFISLFVFPVFAIGINYLNSALEVTMNICIQSENRRNYDVFDEYILSNKSNKINVIKASNPRESLQHGDVDCIVSIYDNVIEFIYNSRSYNSMYVTTKLGDNFQQFYNNKISMEYEGIRRLNLKDENGKSADFTNSISDIFIPVALIMLVFQGVVNFSNDIFAGERERKTLELLFLSGIKRKYIYYGKGITLIILSLINLFICLSSYIISMCLGYSEAQQPGFLQSGSIWINIVSMALSMLLLSANAIFFSLTISMVSKSLKRAQTLNEIFLLIPTALTLLSA